MRWKTTEPVGRLLFYWLPPLAWMGLIFCFSSQSSLPHAREPWFDVLLKKTGHAVAYGILAWLYLRLLRGLGHRAAVARATSFGLAVAYGLSDEIHQSFVPGRNGQLLDVLVDGLGAAGAMLLDWTRQRRRALEPASSPHHPPGAR